MTRLIRIMILLALITGCASTPPLDLTNIDFAITPQTVLATPDTIGHTVLWGGLILSSRNFKEYTQLEVLSYPVDQQGRIQRKSEPMGRFYARYPGYLETAEYRANRWITLTGSVRGVETGVVGNANYRFPVLDVRQLYLWSEQALQDNSPQLHFGIGVIFH
jgi:outer membrane lipoprotein